MWVLAHRRGGLDSHACRRACRFGFSGYAMIAWWIQTTKQPGSCRSCGAGRDADASRIIDCLITLAQFVRSGKWHYLTLLQSRVESDLLRCCLVHWRCFIFTYNSCYAFTLCHNNYVKIENYDDWQTFDMVTLSILSHCYLICLCNLLLIAIFPLEL